MMLGWLKSERQKNPFPGDTHLDSVRYVVLDTELTSLDPRSNRVLSIGAIVMEGPRIRLGEQFYRTMNPGVPIPPDSVLIHQLRSEDLDGAELPGDVLKNLLKFVTGSVLVGHFVHFDRKALWKELGDDRHRLDNPAVDTARAHHWILRHGRHSDDLAIQLEQQDLTALARYYQLEVHDSHHALADAFVAAQLWQRMLARLAANGIHTLRDLLKIAAI